MLTAAAFIATLLLSEDVAVGPKSVAILPLGHVARRDLRAAEAAIHEMFPRAQVSVLQSSELPSQAFSRVYHRYRADRMLPWLQEKSRKTEKVVGLMSRDMSTTSRQHADWGILGLGQLGGRACVVSTWRLTRGHASRKLVEQRIGRIVIHELGHTLGLPHCPTAHCLMQDAGGSLKNTDSSSAFCPKCARQLAESSAH